MKLVLSALMVLSTTAFSQDCDSFGPSATIGDHTRAEIGDHSQENVNDLPIGDHSEEEVNLEIGDH